MKTKNRLLLASAIVIAALSGGRAQADFTKITTGSIVTNVGTGTACAWGDYDNDGFIDLIVTSSYDLVTGNAQKNILYHNNGNGTFTSITNTPITTEARDWRGCSWVDYDNDGNLDLFVTSTDSNGFSSQNELFRQNDDGTFTKMAATAVGAILPGGGDSEGPVWADYDRDGFLDVFVVRHGADWLFHNNSNGTFTKVPNTNGIPLDSSDNYRAMWGDYDNDGWPDLFLPIRATDDFPLLRSVLYHGLGGGTFTNLQTGSVVTNLGQAPGCGWGDYDNDGYLDLFVTSRTTSGLPNSLYHNNGDGTFTKMASNMVGSIVSDLAGLGFSDCSWGDYDNDGFLDLLVVVGSDGVNPAFNYLYHNNGNGTFTRITDGIVVNDPANSVGCGWGDYNNDGFLDLFVASGGGRFQTARNLLYRNNGNSNTWIKIKLVGTASNRSAVGAKVRVQATIRGNPIWQLREINTGTGFSGSPLEAHFGLGDATNIDLVRIEWPSGIVQTLTNVASMQILSVVEHQQPGPATAPSFTGVSRAPDGSAILSAAGDPNLLYVFEASTNLMIWTKVGVRSNATGSVVFTDTKATNYAARFYRVSVP